MAWLLDRLREAGADEQAAALADRAAAHVALDDPADVAWLLDRLREAGAQEQAAALAERAAAHVPLDDPARVARLLGSLREAGAQEQAAALADRLPGAGCSSSSASKRTARIGSGSAGRLTAAQPGHGAGKIWTDVAGLSNTGTRPVSVRGSATGHAGASPDGTGDLRKRCLVRPVRSIVR